MRRVKRSDAHLIVGEMQIGRETDAGEARHGFEVSYMYI